ncbi:MAG: hypothetical protein J6X72_04165, partial [Clostridia bacterium]|nr:hypothetical protein [Clostridia bacterium]
TPVQTTEATTAQTTAEEEPEPEPEPVILGTHLRTAPDVSYVATPYATQSDKYTAKILQKALTTSGATIVNMPSREGVEYPRKLPAPASLTRANSRDELVKIVNWYAFYRESGFSVTLGYAASDVEAELNYLWRHSDLLASQCSLFGSLQNGVITVDLKFYPESYLAYPRYTTPAKYIAVETTPPKWTDTLPGLDPEHGVSVWDSEQACYALANGYKIAPIPGSPAESLVNTAKTILAGMIDDTMTEWQIAYRVYVWLVDHAAYDQAEHWADGETLDKSDVAKESEAVSSRVIGFRAEGPLLYGVGACFGFAKASVLLLGLEGIELRRVVAFSTKLREGRSCILKDGESIAIHSYLYLRIGGYDYIFDPTFVGETKQTIGGVNISVFRDFSIGMSFAEHRAVFGTHYSEPDFYSETDAYRPASYNYLIELGYDKYHDQVLSTQAEAKHYYDYLLETVFSQPAEYRTVTLFYGNITVSDWSKVFRTQLLEFLAKTGVPCSTPNPQTFNRQ